MRLARRTAQDFEEAKKSTTADSTLSTSPTSTPSPSPRHQRKRMNSVMIKGLQQFGKFGEVRLPMGPSARKKTLTPSP